MPNRTFTSFAFAICCAIGAPIMSANAQQASPKQVMVVLDASGSMWGQIDGVTKIEIARNVFTDLSQDWTNQQIEAGLLAYGHRRKGDCTDIELISTPSRDSTATMGNVVNTIKPKGKTPLSEAVRQAAMAMRFSEEAATVILLSDGRETCAPNPCAVAEELEDLGVNFTAHVIGFDVADPKDIAQLRCIATATGGRYFDAKDADQLTTALNGALDQPVAQPEGPQTFPLTIKLAYIDETARPQQVTIFAQDKKSGENIVLGTLSGADQIIPGITTDLPAGDWQIVAESDEGRGEIDVAINGNTKEIEIPFLGAEPTFQLVDGSPYALGIEHNFFLTLNGGVQPGQEYPVQLVDLNDKRLDWETRFGSDGLGISVHSFTSPSQPGDYRIIVGEPDAPLAAWPIRYEANVTPEWRGPRNGAPGAALPLAVSGNTYYYNSFVWVKDGEPAGEQQLGNNGAPLILPMIPGTYELRYTYRDAQNENQTQSLGEFVVGSLQNGTSLPDDPDSVSPPANIDQETDQGTGEARELDGALDANAHGWEPSSPPATADAALLYAPQDVAQTALFTCRAPACHYSNAANNQKNIPLRGDWAVIASEQRRDGKPFIILANEINGEWVELNPTQQTDMTTDCVEFSDKGWHAAPPAGGHTDMACTVKGGNGETFTMMEELASWAAQRNAARLASSESTPLTQEKADALFDVLTNGE